ncbi:MAG: serine/threonine-protein kinase [Polyangiaceae bacterium]|nr:serine/threonine-protein kinase [Polyangiaceae bacterium]
MGLATGIPEHKGPLTGARLGRYRVGGRLGSGGTASVYLAVSTGPHSFGRLVALKVIHEHLLGEKAFVDMFVDEANLAVRLNHPNVVHVYDLLQEESRLVLAMEYLHGQPLSRLVSRIRQRGDRLPYPVVAWIAARALEGLHEAHQLLDEHGDPAHVVHRDVSPQNIFVTYSGNVKIIDFGIARAEGRLQQTDLGQVKGKFAYMAPEQALSRDYDHRADIFSLGVTLYEAAVGARLFPDLDRVEALHKIVMGDIPDPRERVADFPEGLRKIVLRALEGAPEKRFQSAKEMAEALDAYVATMVTTPVAEQLAAIMNEQFREERSEQETATALLKQGQSGSFKEETDSTFSVASNTTVLPAPTSAKYRTFALVAALLALGAYVAFDRFVGDLGHSAGEPQGASLGSAAAPPTPGPVPAPSTTASSDLGRAGRREGAAGSPGQLEKASPPKRSPLVKSYPF